MTLHAHAYLIDKSGGSVAVAEACGVRPGSVYQWRMRGIPARFWHVVDEMGAVSVHELAATKSPVPVTFWPPPPP